jgi:hypothetical protein
MPAVLSLKQLPGLMTAKACAEDASLSDEDKAKKIAGANEKGAALGKIESWIQGGACLPPD